MLKQEALWTFVNDDGVEVAEFDGEEGYLFVCKDPDDENILLFSRESSELPHDPEWRCTVRAVERVHRSLSSGEGTMVGEARFILHSDDPMVRFSAPCGHQEDIELSEIAGVLRWAKGEDHALIVVV